MIVISDQVFISGNRFDVNTFLEEAYKVGTFFITFQVNGYPPIGTWQLLTSGTTIVGADGTPGFTAGATGGSNEKKIVSHSHAIPSHNHTIPGLGTRISPGSDAAVEDASAATSSHAGTWAAIVNATVQTVGDTEAGLNMQPSTTAYIYERVA